jgi:hypothetical protein
MNRIGEVRVREEDEGGKVEPDDKGGEQGTQDLRR